MQRVKVKHKRKKVREGKPDLRVGTRSKVHIEVSAVTVVSQVLVRPWGHGHTGSGANAALRLV